MVGSRSLHLMLVLGVLVAFPAMAQQEPAPSPPSAPDPPPDQPVPDAPSNETEPEPPDDTAPEPPSQEPPSEPPPEQPPSVAPAPPPLEEPTLPPDDAPAVAAFPDDSSSPPPPAPRPIPAPPPATPPSTTSAPAPPPQAAAPPVATPPPTPSTAPPADAIGSDWNASERDSRTDQDDGKDRRALRLGPIVGAGLPSLLSFGGQLKLMRFFGAGINIGLIPSVRIDYYGQATLRYQEYDAYGRLYPFGNSLFVGAGVGYATVTGVLIDQVDLGSYAALDPSLPASFELRSEGSVQTMVLTPQVGLFKTLRSGFSIGLDVGAQVPIAPSDVKFKTEVPDATPQPVIDQYVEPNDEKVRSTLDKLGQTPVPTFNFRLGWLL